MTADLRQQRAGIVPQFNITRPCACCPFRVGGEMGPLGTTTAERVTASIDDDAPFACHRTTTMKGRATTHPKARYCAGAMLYALAREAGGVAPLPTFMQLGERLGLWSRDELEPVQVWASKEEFMAYHTKGD